MNKKNPKGSMHFIHLVLPINTGLITQPSFYLVSLSLDQISGQDYGLHTYNPLSSEDLGSDID